MSKEQFPTEDEGVEMEESAEEGEFHPETHADQFLEEQEAEVCAAARSGKTGKLMFGVAAACAGALLTVWGFMDKDWMEIAIGMGALSAGMDIVDDAFKMRTSIERKKQDA